MKPRCFVAFVAMVLFTTIAGRAQNQAAKVVVELTNTLGLMRMDQMALGQGGLSEQPIFADRVQEIRALRPRIIRLFVQEYFDLLPERGRYHFEALDRSVDMILARGAK